MTGVLSAEVLTGETVELLQAMIRNRCVNDGTAASGFETRNADLLRSFLGSSGLDTQHFEPTPGRGSLVARIEGSDPAAPSLCLMGHTDVVPVNERGWSRDPFGGELVDGEVWGRGAIDMLNITASMATAFKHLARSGFRPKGTLIYFGVADEEAGGRWGAEWMVDEHWDAIASDYVLTEMGGWSSIGDDGVRRIVVNTGEKGIAWRRLRVTGTPAHGSMPFGADNALIKAAEIVRRLAAYRPQAHISGVWRAQVGAMRLPDELKRGLLDPARIMETIEQLPAPQARYCHAVTHTTFSPNVAHGGQKTNMIPDVVDLDVAGEMRLHLGSLVVTGNGDGRSRARDPAPRWTICQPPPRSRPAIEQTRGLGKISFQGSNCRSPECCNQQGERVLVELSASSQQNL
jgi:acetylornithine deacetylase/succinyl-diaminopimelate desuccinylase-like protein